MVALQHLTRKAHGGAIYAALSLTLFIKKGSASQCVLTRVLDSISPLHLKFIDISDDFDKRPSRLSSRRNRVGMFTRTPPNANHYYSTPNPEENPRREPIPASSIFPKPTFRTNPPFRKTLDGRQHDERGFLYIMYKLYGKKRCIPSVSAHSSSNRRNAKRWKANMKILGEHAGIGSSHSSRCATLNYPVTFSQLLLL